MPEKCPRCDGIKTYRRGSVDGYVEGGFTHWCVVCNSGFTPVPEVKFYDEFEPLLLSHPPRKWATTRTKKIGRVGDRFTAFGEVFELTLVEKKWIREIALDHHVAEGFLHRSEFIEVWMEIHPRAGMTPKQYWYHEFKHVGPVDPMARGGIS